MQTNKVVALPALTGSTPTMSDIMAIPKARSGEYELSDTEAKRLRAKIYSLNKNNAAGRRWRTVRDGTLLMVWRIK